MSAEQWRPVVGWEDRYDVSNLGRVRSRTTYHGARPPRIMATESDRYGYHVVRFNTPDGRTKHKVHLLVIEAFRGPRPEGLVTRHLDGNPANNALANLAYGTQQQNMLDTLVHGTNHWASRTHCANNHEFTPENTRRKPSKAGRICVTCYRTRARNRQRARRAAAKAAA